MTHWAYSGAIIWQHSTLTDWPEVVSINSSTIVEAIPFLQNSRRIILASLYVIVILIYETTIIMLQTCFWSRNLAHQSISKSYCQCKNNNQININTKGLNKKILYPLLKNYILLWWGAQRLNWAGVCDIHQFDCFVSGKCKKKTLFRSFMFNLLFNALFNCGHSPLFFLVTLFSFLQLILMLSSNCPTNDRWSVLRLMRTSATLTSNVRLILT